MNAKTDSKTAPNVAATGAAVADSAASARRKAAKSIITDGAGVPIGVQFLFSNGAVRRRLVADYPPAVREWLAVHGLSQTLGDAYSQATSVIEALGLHDKRHDALVAGALTTRRGPRGTNWHDVARAYVEVRGLDPAQVDVVREAILAKSDPERAALVRNPKIAVVLARYELEALQRAADAGDDGLAIDDLIDL